MKLPETGMLMRIYIGEKDKIDGKPLFEQIVLHARKLNVAGATVFQGIMGFGADSRMHTSKILRLSDDLPILIELVDTDTNLQKIIPFLDEHVEEGLITMEKVNVIKYRHSNPPK